MLFTFELNLSLSGWLTAHVQVFTRILTADFCFVHFIFTLPSYLEITFFFPVVTFMDHPFAYMLHFSGGHVLKGSLVLRYSGWGEVYLSLRIKKHPNIKRLFYFPGNEI